MNLVLSSQENVAAGRTSAPWFWASLTSVVMKISVENEAICVALYLAGTAQFWFACAAMASPVPCVVFGEALGIIYIKFSAPKMPTEH